jgi:hypothetical protein
VLSYDTSSPGASLTALREWNLTESLPSVSANQGLEALTFIPDAAVVAGGLVDDSGDTYDPAAYPAHGDGLFAVGIEASSMIYFFALGTDGSIARIATASTPLTGVMGLEYDRDVGYLWAYCDDTCGNRAAILLLGASVASDAGHFTVRAELMRPSSLPNANNEGIAIAPESECVDGRKSFYWVEDGTTNGHVLRVGTIPCGAFL